MLKIICLLGLLVFSCQELDAVPHGPKSILDMSQSELIHKFEQFIQEDKQAAEIRKVYEQEFSDHKLSKRQAENEMENPDDFDVQKAEGFLDRAAKFVLELVQRFLKWINTD